MPGRTIVRRTLGPVLLFLALSLGSAAGATDLDVDQAIRIALERNADLRIAASDVDSAKARMAGASLLFQGNPEIGAFGGQRSGGAEKSTDYGLSIAQPLDIPGSRGARIEAADAGLKSAEARLQVRRGAVVAAVRQAFARVLAAQARAKLADEALTLANEALVAANERQNAGEASLIEVNTARVELGRSKRESLASAQRLLASLGELRLVLGFEPREALSLRGTLEQAWRAAPHLSDLTTAARERRADLVAARAELAEAEAEHRLALGEAFPRPSVGLSYEREEGADVLLGTFSIDAPVFNRNQAGRGAAQARLSRARDALKALERTLEAEVEIAFTRREAAQAAVETFSGDAAKAIEGNLELAIEGYRAGNLDFVQLLLIRRGTLDARREYIDALEELNVAEADLDRVLGTTP